MSVFRISKTLHVLGEGPHWEAREEHLYFVDINGKHICRLNPLTGVTEQLQTENFCSFVIPYQSDPSCLLVSSTKQIEKLDWNTREKEFLTQVDYTTPNVRLNDGKCDAKGRLWVGTMIHDVVRTLHKKCHLFKMDNTYKMTKVDDGISLSNGIAWNSNNDTMYYIDSDCQAIFAYDFNLEDGSITNKRKVLDYNKDKGFENVGSPDGMTIDTENKLWVCQFGGGCVLRIDPETKTILRRFHIPANHVTSCCFGGPNLDVLYVTTAGKTEEIRKQFPEAGAVFAITDHGCKGLPAYAFNA